MCLWCASGALDVLVMCGGACWFSGLTFSHFPISLTAYQHLKALQINNMYLCGLQRSFNVITYHIGRACGVPVVPVVCLWCLCCACGACGACGF
jgi:hypothetical protein